MGFLNKHNHYIYVSCNFWRTSFLEDVQPSILIWNILKKNLFKVGSWPESNDSCPKKGGFSLLDAGYRCLSQLLDAVTC